MQSTVRISALLWADILVNYSLFVMQNYLTEVWNISFTHAAGILNIWNGIAMILPVFYLFVRDAKMGYFGALVTSSIAYSLGIGFVTMSAPPVLANPCKQYESKCVGTIQRALFYIGMALIAEGMAGNLICVPSFLDQKEKIAHEEPSYRLCIQTRSSIIVVVVSIVGAFALPYIKPWTLRFGIPAICTFLAMFIFLTGLCCYRYTRVKPTGSPVTQIFRVFSAFVFKLRLPHPLDEHQLYSKEGELFRHTRFLRILEKAAIIREDMPLEDQEKNRWRLCSLGEVEDAKIVIRMIPMWLTFIICGLVSSIGNTYFVEQGSKLNRHIGKWNVPLPALLLFFRLAKGLFGVLVTKQLRAHKTYGPPIGIGIAMLFSILCCITAAKIEQRRLNVIREHDLIDKPQDNIPMSIYFLLSPFCLLAGLDSFFEKSVGAFYDNKGPETMKEYLVCMTKGVFGLGYMSNVLLVHVVGKISPNWFQFTLNKSRLDRYYWVLSALSSVNLFVFIIVACSYRYKNRYREERMINVETGCLEADHGIWRF